MRLPDFIVAGAPRCGTTWLWELLERHPDVTMARPVRPEPKFFLVDNLYAQGLRYYSDTWFKNARTAVTGEKSSNYLESSLAAERIFQAIPNVRLIFCFRDPVVRAWSNYLWSKQNGIERLTFDEAISIEYGRETPEEMKFAKPYSYVARGYYADLLRPYLSMFPMSALHFVKTEAIAERPTEVARGIHRFLGVREQPGDADGLPAKNATLQPRESMAEECRDELIRRYARPNQEFAAMTGLDISDWLS